MKFIEILGASLLILSLISIASADIGLDIHCYNSEGDMSFSLDAENTDYEGAFELASHGISFKNVGESTEPESSYSLHQSFNGNSEYSSATTNSGSYEWAAQMSTGIDNTDSTIFKIGAIHNVDDGFLSSVYGNDGIAVHSDVITSKASYSEKVSISEDSLIAAGSGETHFQETPDLNIDFSYEPLFSNGVLSMTGEYYHAEKGSGTSEASSEQVPSDAGSDAEESVQEPTEIDTLPGFIQEVYAAEGGEWTRLKGAVIGKENDDAVVKWAYGLESGGSDSLDDEYPYTLGLAASGVSTEGFNIMAMEGEGSDIPMQRLPPGSFEIDYQSDIDSIIYDLIKSQYSQYINEQTNEFYEEYGSPEDLRPTDWYSWNHMAFLSVADSDGDSSDLEENNFEYFKMVMKFDVNSDDSIEDSTPIDEDSQET